jgi:hypothetical protein
MLLLMRVRLLLVFLLVELRPLMMRIISTQLALDWSAFRARFSP